MNVNEITTENKRKKNGDIPNLFVSKIEGQILENIAVKILYNTIALRLHFPRLLSDSNLISEIYGVLSMTP